MRTGALALVALIGCGNDSGILVSVTRDDTVTATVESLHFVIGVADATGAYVRDDFGAETYADVIGRDLVADPFTLFLIDRGARRPSSVVVAVIGEASGQPVAFAGMAAPMTFPGGGVLEVGLTLTADTGGFTSTATGCLRWGGITVVSPADLDCDGCDDATGAGCGTECAVAGDCDAAYGPPPCGAWECNQRRCDVVCANCADADLDGYGVGLGCAGADCDDADDAIIDGSTTACYSGDPSTVATGVCRAGTHTCRGGVWTPCSGEVIPGGEGCDLEDDDCDGQIDENLGTIGCGLGACATTGPACVGGATGACVPLAPAMNDAVCDGIDGDCDGSVDEDCTCVVVAPVASGGNDVAAGLDNNTTPFATIQAAITWAAADAARPRVVCLASCGVTGFYPGAVTMASGIHVAGGYDLARNRCGTPATIQTGTATGVLFDAAVQAPTTLDRVIVNRLAAATTAAVTVDGATGVTLNQIQITNAPPATTSYGVNLINGGTALITGSRIHGGNGTATTIGIRSVGSLPTVRDNCSGYDGQGRCARWCDQQAWIQGRTIAGTGEVYAVWLEDSPGADVDRSSLCAINGDSGAVVRITGAASGVTVRRSYVEAWGPTVASTGVLADDCAGASPWITDNGGIWAAGDLGTTVVSAVRALGDCHPVIEANVRIMGGTEGATVGTTGVYCGRGTSAIASRCVVLDNPVIQASEFGFPPDSVGVACEDGGCMRVARNGIDAHGGVNTIGVLLGRTGALIENNRITGGCGLASSIGVRAVASSARLENNQIFAGACPNPGASSVYVGLDVELEGGPSELDVHSNHIDGDGAAATCRSVGIRLAPGATPPTAGSGRFRNNIVRAGRCSIAYGIEETATTADPRELWNNDLAPLDTPTALYRDEGTTDLPDPGSVNALTDVDARANISADPVQASYPADLHLASGSVCVGAGTAAGAPPRDMDGDPRDPVAPDIGPDEQ